MKCEKCGLNMRIDHVNNGTKVYVCVNRKCENYLKPNIDGEKVLTKDKTE